MARTGFTAAALLVLFACSGGEEPDRPLRADRRAAVPQAPGAGRQDLSGILAIHNRERAAAGVPPLVWDERLAAGAAAYGPELARIGRLVHSPRSSRPGEGENLWMGTHEAYRIEAMAAAWAAERSMFRRGVFPNVSTTGNWQDVAHYTQMIWRGTARVGCAIHESREWDYLICRYAPAGNVVGERVP